MIACHLDLLRFVKADAAMEHQPRKADNRPLALTLGEPAGIGPDIALKAWLRRDELKLPAFYWLGDPASLDRRAKALSLNVRLAEVRPPDLSALHYHASRGRDRLWARLTVRGSRLSSLA